MVNYQATDIGKATVQVLVKNNVEVVVPQGQRCCSMPSFDLGDTETMVQTATHHLQLFLPYLKQGYDLVVPTPSCSLMFKREYPYLVPTRDMTTLAERTFDICEYPDAAQKRRGVVHGVQAHAAAHRVPGSLSFA